jgi:hypothetical protein
MTSIDGINNMYGRRSIKLAPGIQRGEWSPNQNHFNTQSKTLFFYTGMIDPNVYPEDANQPNTETEIEYPDNV